MTVPACVYSLNTSLNKKKPEPESLFSLLLEGMGHVTDLRDKVLLQ